MKGRLLFLLRVLKYRFFLHSLKGIQHYRRILRVRKNGKANVLFIASNLPMWKYQGLYELMSQDTRFDASILIYPFNTYTPEQRSYDAEILKAFFTSKGIQVIDLGENLDVIHDMNPDMIFYPQPYPGLYGNLLEPCNFEDRLLCYFPYGLFTQYTDWAYNTRFHNIAWKLFYPTEYHRKDAGRLAYNGGKNVCIVGEPDADYMRAPHKENPWKNTDCRKRVIWAPHFSISKDRLMNRDSFMWMSDLMLEIAEEYADRIQIAFKPHPRLKTELYLHQDWGKQRTDEYYALWDSMPDTQLETGGYLDLFSFSDALIHDSGSFSAVYQYTYKPSLFVSDNLPKIKGELSEFGNRCLDLHYHANTREAVISFIENVVLNEEDCRRSERMTFVDEVMMPPGGRTAAQNAFDEIIRGLGI